MSKIRFDIVSAVPQIFDSVINSSIIKNAQKKELVEINIIDLHKYADNRFGHIDDYPYGGAAGMLLKCEPVFKCIEELISQRHYDEIIYFTPDGEILKQNTCNEFALKQNLILLCGHYKGIDQRIRDLLITREISVGDFVLSGGEIPAMILLDAVVRLIPNVINSAESALEDSFMDGYLEAPQYTRPADFRGHKVPEVLLSGNPKLIDEWKVEESYKKTKLKRPDLLSED